MSNILNQTFESFFDMNVLVGDIEDTTMKRIQPYSNGIQDTSSTQI